MEFSCQLGSRNGRAFNALQSHSALGESSESEKLAVECQKTIFGQLPLIPASAHWLGGLQTGELRLVQVLLIGLVGKVRRYAAFCRHRSFLAIGMKFVQTTSCLFLRMDWSRF